MDEDGYVYYAVCRVCDTVGEFDTRDDRAAWMDEHSRDTGHANWLRRDQPEDPDGFD